MKRYIEYIEEITENQLYRALVGYGLFSEKIPPCFTSIEFMEYCLSKKNNFANREYNFVSYDSIRNINIPRQLSIPTPMAYERLCKCITEYWDKIIEHFKRCTDNQKFKVSRIHIRKMKNKESIFEMNYSDWRMDGTPTSKLAIGMRYRVNADIAKCFPSIYTHSISWALVGKEASKNNRHGNKWYNKLDKACRNIKCGETNGIMIGPHVSNIISEIILCKIDEQLISSGWRYVRNIDDYTAYVKSEEDAGKFLIELQASLKEYNLQLNHKKTKVFKLPQASSEVWTREINMMSLSNNQGKVDYNICRRYLDNAIEIATKENDNASVYKYAIKVLNGMKLTANAKMYEQDVVFHLALIYPYVVPLLHQYVFKSCDTNPKDVRYIANAVYEEYFPKLIYEAASYSIYWCIIYDITLDKIDVEEIIESKDCIILVLAYIYFKKKKDNYSCDKLVEYAEILALDDDEFERNWIFTYEVLPEKKLVGEWKELKRNKVSFLKFD